MSLDSLRAWYVPYSSYAILIFLAAIPFATVPSGVVSDAMRNISTALLMGGVLFCAATQLSISTIWPRGLAHAFMIGCFVIAVATVAAFTDHPTRYSITGFAFEIGTPLSYGILLIAYLAGLVVSSVGARAFVLPAFGIGASVLGGIYVLGHALQVDVLLMLTPDWYSLHCIFGLGIMALVSYMLDQPRPRSMFVIVTGCSAFLFFLILESRSSEMYVLVALPLAGVLLGHRYSAHRQGTLRDQYFHRIAEGGVVLLLILASIGPARLIPTFFVFDASQELRPSLVTTTQIIGDALGSDTMLLLKGGGVHAFQNAWNTYRTPEINTSPLWDSDFKYGYGLLPTLVMTSGAIAVLMLVVMSGVFVASSVHAWHRTRSHSPLFSASVMVFGILISLFSVPNLTILGMLALLVGMESRTHDDPLVRMLPAPWQHIVVRALLVLLALIALVLMWVSAVRLTALFAYGEAQAAASDNQRDIAEQKLSASIARDPLPEVHSALVHLYQQEIQSIVTRNDTSGENERVTALLNKIPVHSDAAIALHPRNFRFFIDRGNTALMSAFLHRDPALLESAQAAYQHAQGLAPRHPLPLFLLAVINYHLGDMERARTYSANALAQKPNYTQALEMIERIEQTP